MIMPKPHIAYLITSLGAGGAQNQLVNLAERLKERGWSAEIITMLDTENVYQPEAAGIPVTSLHMQRGRWTVGAVWRLAATLRRSKPAVVHSYLVHANLLARVARLFYWVPVQISSARNIIEGGRIREIAYRLTDPLCDTTTQNSRQGAERYITVGAVPAKKMRVIFNGIDADRFRPDPVRRSGARDTLGLGEEFAWLSVGRLEPGKDYPTLIQAFAQVVSQQPRCRLLIAGDGRLRAELESLARAQEPDGRVRFLGFRDDIPDLMQGADAFVMSSTWEGTPNVVLEAAASGLPVVATDVGGNPDIILNGESGYLVPPRDRTTLAGRMTAVMTSSDPERRQMGERGRAHIEAQYCYGPIVDQWEALYMDLLKRKSNL
jgi:glycosyltransferase involved in cell wall biosynthesis